MPSNTFALWRYHTGDFRANSKRGESAALGGEDVARPLRVRFASIIASMIRPLP